MDNIEKTISENTKAILLLTTYFNNHDIRQCKPLTVNGYGYFARWLNTFEYQPSDLLNQTKLDEVFERWQSPENHLLVKQKVALNKIDQTINDITPQRISALLDRGVSLSMALEKWSAAGVWILDRGHTLYPPQFKSVLKEQAPAVLFGIGNAQLLSKPSVGFVGSRDAEDKDLEATDHYVQMINNIGFQVVSGGAKGIDSRSMLSSLSNGNSSVGVLADSLLKASVNSQWRPYLKSNSLALITNFSPESRFSPANAMARNKFIYLLSQATIVVCSGESNKNKKSGTFEGARENLKNKWVPLLVSQHKTPIHSGNLSLLKGLSRVTTEAKPLSLNTDLEYLNAVINGKDAVYKESILNNATPIQAGLFDSTMEQDDESAASTIQNRKSDIIPLKTVKLSDDLIISKAIEEHKLALSNVEIISDMPLLNSFYEQLKVLFDQHAILGVQEYINIKLIEERFPEFEIMGKTALDKWLKYLVDNKLLMRSSERKKEFCLPIDC